VDAAALAGLLGAVIGGGATLLGSLLASRQQAGHERDKWLRDWRASAYHNTVRYLLRTANLRSEIGVEPGPLMAMRQVPEFFNDLVEAQYWLAVLTTVCGRRQRAVLEGASRRLNQLIASEPAHLLRVEAPGDQPRIVLAVNELYELVLACARRDA
jgi:hypothetical protein